CTRRVGSIAFGNNRFDVW
nr:immunoglobulin heavy chain junction region [Macaca mulatta]